LATAALRRGAAAVVLPWLMFWQPPILVGIGADALLVAALVWSIRSGRSVPPHEGGPCPERGRSRYTIAQRR
jgi:hypothetical protein